MLLLLLLLALLKRLIPTSLLLLLPGGTVGAITTRENPTPWILYWMPAALWTTFSSLWLHMRIRRYCLFWLGLLMRLLLLWIQKKCFLILGTNNNPNNNPLSRVAQVPQKANPKNPQGHGLLVLKNHEVPYTAGRVIVRVIVGVIVGLNSKKEIF